MFADRNSSGNGGSGLGARGDVLLATGGEDGVLRVWELRADRSEFYVDSREWYRGGGRGNNARQAC